MDIALRPFRGHLKLDGVLLAICILMAALSLVSVNQAWSSAAFAAGSLLHIAPYLAGSIFLTAFASASDLDNLIGRAFSGHPAIMVLLGSLAGAISPFCSCGVIPLIAALLAMRVPLAAVMAFWLASPLMDPSMFVLTAGILGLEFAIFKTVAAVATGLAGGIVVLALDKAGLLFDPLRQSVRSSTCGAPALDNSKPVTWRFWDNPARRSRFAAVAASTAFFLGKWLALAYILESLLLAYVPAELIVTTIGGEGVAAVGLAVAVGIPAYLNGFAATPLVAGLIEQGMKPGAAMAFLLAGGVTSIPAAMAVFALVRPRIFAIYILVALLSAFLLGSLYNISVSSGVTG